MIKDILMMGGGKELRKVLSSKSANYSSMVTVLITLSLVFFIRALVVQVAYNKIAPKVIEQWKGRPSTYKPLTFEESLFFILFVSFLFM
jgi:hypothetical protein